MFISGIEGNVWVSRHGDHLDLCEEAPHDNGERLTSRMRNCSMMAVYTFWDAGYTGRTSMAQLPALTAPLIEQRLNHSVVWAGADSDISLSFIGSEDHQLVQAAIVLSVTASTQQTVVLMLPGLSTSKRCFGSTRWWMVRMLMLQQRGI